MHLTGVHLTGVRLISVHLTGMCVMGVYLTGVYLIGVYLINVHLTGSAPNRPYKKPGLGYRPGQAWGGRPGLVGLCGAA